MSIKFSSQRSTFFGQDLKVKSVKKVEKRFLHTAVDYKGDAAASEAELRHDFRLSGTIYPLECLESEGENQQSFIVQEVVRGLRKESIEHETFYQAGRDIRFLTPIRRCIPESTDNRPQVLYLCGSLGMFLVSLLYELKCLRKDLIKINCCLNICSFDYLVSLCVQLGNF